MNKINDYIKDGIFQIKLDDKENSIKKNRYLIFTFLIFLVFFLVRIYLSFQSPYFSDESSYLHLRYAKNIAENGPFSTDYFSYGGRKIPFISMADYILAGLSLMGDMTIAAKILNELISAGFIILTFLICREISKNDKASFIAAIICTTVPYFTKNTFNTFNPEIIGLFLIMILLLLFLKMRKDKKYSSFYVFTLVLASSISPIILLFTISLIVFYIISSAYGIKLEKYEKELIIFSLFVSIIIELVFLRETLMSSGFSTIWGNAPSYIIKTLFPELSLIYTSYLLGVITVLISFRTTYLNLVKRNRPSFFIMFSIALTTFIFLWARLIQYNQGILIISVILPIITGYFFSDMEEYLTQTKISNLKNIIISFFLIIVLISNIIPVYSSSLNYETIVDKYDVAALEWLKDNTYLSDTIFSTFNYGNIVSYYSQRRTIANTQYLGIKNIDLIFKDINSIMVSTSKTNVIGLLNKYDASYLIFNKITDSEINNNKLFSDECFENVYDNKKIRILKLKCRLEE